ncbi:MAG: hypothetical protein PHD34_09185 [Methanothrix soehngenii]|nr:hypothetical protein [Methanothrix soehngenii]
MRDRRFITERRGGLLQREDHRALMDWAVACSLHILPYATGPLHGTALHALETAKDWASGKATTGEAIEAARAVHAVAKITVEPLMKLVYRCIGQAVSTAHMADHCLGPAWYGRKIVQLIGSDVAQEREWQLQRLAQLPPHLADLVANAPKFLAQP